MTQYYPYVSRKLVNFHEEYLQEKSILYVHITLWLDWSFTLHYIGIISIQNQTDQTPSQTAYGVCPSSVLTWVKSSPLCMWRPYWFLIPLQNEDTGPRLVITFIRWRLILNWNAQVVVGNEDRFQRSNKPLQVIFEHSMYRHVSMHGWRTCSRNDDL